MAKKYVKFASFFLVAYLNLFTEKIEPTVSKSVLSVWSDKASKNVYSDAPI